MFGCRNLDDSPSAQSKLIEKTEKNKKVAATEKVRGALFVSDRLLFGQVLLLTIKASTPDAVESCAYWPKRTHVNERLFCFP